MLQGFFGWSSAPGRLVAELFVAYYGSEDYDPLFLLAPQG